MRKIIVGALLGSAAVVAVGLYAHAQSPNLPMVSGPAQSNDTFVFRRNGMASRGKVSEFFIAGPQGPAGATGAAGATGSAGPAGSANNVQFTGSVTIGALLTLGGFTRDITVTGVLATDRLNVMPLADLPADVVLTQARPTTANTVRLYFRGFSLLTANTPISVAITALR